MLSDKKAEELEDKKLFRRAADRWLVVLMSRLTDAERDEARIRRNRCLSRVPRIKPEKQYCRDVHQAAVATEKRMGLNERTG